MKKIFKPQIFNILFFLTFTILIYNSKDLIISITNALSLWATCVLPSLFPFMFLTKVYANYTDNKNNSFSNTFSKLFRLSNSASYIFLLSILSGYPIGAKLTSDYVSNGVLANEEQTKVAILCSTSGPIFIISTIGITMFNNMTAGIIIFISHIVGTILNYFLFYQKNNSVRTYTLQTQTKKNISDIMLESIYAILSVGGYIVLSSIVISIISKSVLFNKLLFLLSKIFNNEDLVQAIIYGFIEVTNGCKIISTIYFSIKLKTIISTFLISFGGLSIILQTLSFLSKTKVNKKTYLLSKFTQGMFCCIVAIILCSIFL